jgi:hypothetical protein
MREQLQHCGSVENAVMPARRVSASSAPGPSRRLTFDAALLADRRIIGPRSARSPGRSARPRTDGCRR